MQKDLNLQMVHAPSQNVMPTLHQDHVGQSSAPLFPQPPIYVCQQVRWNFFNLLKGVNISLTYAGINIALRPILSARRYWPGSSYPSTTSCVSGGFSTPHCSSSSTQCVHAPATTPCLPRCTSILVGLSIAMTYANTDIDFPSERRPCPPPRSFRYSLAHPN